MHSIVEYGIKKKCNQFGVYKSSLRGNIILKIVKRLGREYLK
jgi:hypothetical protein